jgi:DNA-binding response OmpR family regulator
MAISGAAPGTRVIMVDSDQELETAIDGGIDLLMLNRKLDYGFEATDGIDLLRRIRSRRPGQKIMMISNYPEAQESARTEGALPGFGKREIGSAKVRQLITAALNGGE